MKLTAEHGAGKLFDTGDPDIRVLTLAGTWHEMGVQYGALAKVDMEPMWDVLVAPVCAENLNPDVVVMKSAKDGMRPDASGPLNGSRDRCIFRQRPVGSNVVVIAGIGLQDPAQMRLA